MIVNPLCRLLLVPAAIFAFSVSARAQDLRGVGVVLIHGKAGGQAPLGPLAAALKRQGALVSMPRMSWSSGYRTYEATLGEVAAAVSQIRRMGARKVFLAGHSMGANVSLGHAGNGGDVNGVIALAPGHRPDFIATQTGDSLAAAKAMVAAGRGGEKASFKDFNKGRTYPITTTAAAYVSFFDPDGPSARAARARGVTVPVLWVIGRGDRPAMRDPAAFGTGQRIEIDSDHYSTPIDGVAPVLDWLKRQ